MCNPAAMMVAMAVASAGSQMMQQKEMKEAAQERERMATEAAMQQRTLEEKQLQQTLAEAKAGSETDKLKVAREAAKNRGAIRAGAAEAGAFGNLELAELQENMMNEGMDKGLIDYNYRNTLKNADLRGKAADLNMTNTIRANKAPKTNGLLSALQIGAAGAKGAAQGYSMGTSMEGAFSSNGTTDVPWSGIT